MSVTVRAPAKINLHLAVGPLREDGFHPLTTVYQAIGLYDDVRVTRASDWSVRLAGDRITGIPTDGDNLALRAARLFADHHGIAEAAEIAIHKGIPVAGGMAGGSADAAATLVALDRLWHCETPDEDLLDLAARLGSDVPFALVGGTALGGGRGEQVTPLVDRGAWWWVAVESEQGLATPAVYRAFDAVGIGSDPGAPVALLEALATGDVAGLAAALHNDLQGPALSLRPDLEDLLATDPASGAVASLLSGSGPTVLHLCADADLARELRSRLEEAGHGRVSVAPGPVAGAHVVDYA